MFKVLLLVYLQTLVFTLENQTTQSNLKFLEVKTINPNLKFDINPILEFTNGLVEGIEILKEIPDLQFCTDNNKNILTDITKLISIVKTIPQDIPKGSIEFFNCLSSMFNNVYLVFSVCRKIPDEFTNMVQDLKNYFSNPKAYILEFIKNFAYNFLSLDELYVRMKVYNEEAMFRKLGLSCGRLIKGALLPNFSKK